MIRWAVTTLSSRGATAAAKRSFVCAGCVIFGAAVAGADALESDYAEVASILSAHCLACHSPGQIGPMSLASYDEVRPWAKAIRRVVENREMPPFHAEGPIGRFLEDPRLTEDQIASILTWVDGGALRGEYAAEAKHEAIELWPFGTPDVIVDLPAYRGRGTRDDEVYLYSSQVFPENVWIKSVAFRPKEYEAVHHCNLFLAPSEDPVPAGGVSREGPEHLLRLQPLHIWQPGSGARYLPEGFATQIPGGTRVIADVHYAPTGEPIDDISQVGIYFATDTIRYQEKWIGSIISGINIPPRQAGYTLADVQAFPEDALVTGFSVHMHYRGTSSRIRFTYPDGRDETIFAVPRYDFSWQRMYFLAEPVAVPKGTAVEFTAVWDNSAENPRNPDPAKRVRWGSRSSDEMYTAGVSYISGKQDLEPIVVRAGRVVSGDGPAF